MKALINMGILAVLASAQGVGYAQATNASPLKAVTKITCKDYVEMD